ncbi:hypothetical protein BDA96_08G095700 [Sorghum bicolor]|uniref:RING-type domain-containing protein n=1 Tax=Sorghum bicolor TaxID=4558 RepID=A0A921U7Q4_SORBI|nr:hypothetical protein BDA96_08G095700 [Sorghum bicolor]
MGGEDLEGDAAPSCSDNGSAYEHATEELATVTLAAWRGGALVPAARWPCGGGALRSWPDGLKVDGLTTVADGLVVAERVMCPVCLSKPRDMAFGCGHQTCSECGPQVADCPICRRPIDTRVKLY